MRLIEILDIQLTEIGRPPTIIPLEQMEKAWELFQQPDATFDSVSQATGISKTKLYLYFQTKANYRDLNKSRKRRRYFTDNDIKAICTMFRNGESQLAIGKQFDIEPDGILKVLIKHLGKK